MSIRPIGKKVLLSVVEAGEQSVGGIIVKGEARRDGIREAVVAGLPNGYSGDLAVGDTVYIKPWCGTETVYNKTRFVFAKEDEILASADTE